MFRSVRARLLLTYSILIGVILSVFAITLLLFIVRNPLPIRQATLRVQDILVQASTQERFSLQNPAQIRQLMQRVDENQDIRLVILSARGEPLIDSRSETAPSIPIIDLPNQRQFDRAGQGLVGSFRDEAGALWLYAVRPVTDGRFLMAAVPRSTIPWREVIQDDLLPPLLQGGFVAILLAVILAYAMSRWIASPLHRIALSVRGLGSTQFEPILPEGPAEVQDLAAAFNEMTSRVSATQQSQRDFVANVSHELKTPLTSIQGFAQAILDGTASDPNVIQQSAEIIYDEAGRMHRMVVDLLDLARLDGRTAKFERAPLDMAGVLGAVVSRLTPQAIQAEVSIRLELSPFPAMIGDGDRLSQVFTNLVDNALSHTPKGGEVIVKGEAVPGGWVVVSILDSGPGINPQEQNRIFERFYQVDKSRPGGGGRGAGLGLAIAQEIVHMHGGAITVFSEPGQGSNFMVKLPVMLPEDSTFAARI